MAVVGLDVSSWQSGINPRASRVPLGFIIIKSSEGGSPDPRYRQFYQQSSGSIPIIGAYHYLRSNSDLNTQIRTQLASTSGTNPNFYAVDFEEKGNAITPQFANMAKAYVTSLHSITGKPVFLYTNQSLYDQYFRGSNVPLWLAAPSGIYLRGVNPTFVQTQFNAPGAPYGVSGGGPDVNIFPGTMAQLQQALQTGQAPVSGSYGSGGGSIAQVPVSGGGSLTTIATSGGVQGTPGGGASPLVSVNLLPPNVSGFLSSSDFPITIVTLAIGGLLVIFGLLLLFAPVIADTARTAIKVAPAAAMI